MHAADLTLEPDSDATAQAERALASLAAIVSSCEDAVIGKTLHGQITSWNRGAQRIYGYSAAEALGQSISMLVPDGHEDEIAEILATVAAGDSVSCPQTVRRRKDGQLVDVSLSISPILIAGEVTGASTIARDITEQQRSERELARLAQAVEHGSDAIISCDLDSRISHWNAGAERMYGFCASEVLGIATSELRALVAGDEPPSVDDSEGAVRRALRGESSRLEVRRRRKDGASFDALVTVTPWRFGERVVGATVTAVDISQRKSAERAAASLVAIISSCEDAVIGKTLHGEITSWNCGAERIYGYSAAEVLGQPISMLVPDGHEDEIAEILAAVAAGDSVSAPQAVRRRKDGQLIDVSLSISPILIAGEVTGASTIARDITEQKHSERELARLAQAVEHGADSIISCDLDLRVTHWNAGAEQMYGFCASEVLGMKLAEAAELVAADPRARADIQNAFDGVLRDERGCQLETRRRRKDGTEFDALITITPWRLDGRVVGVTSAALDISQRKRAERERERALADMREAQRLAKIGSWVWNSATGQATWSAQTCALFGRDPWLDPPVGEAFLDYVHPEDRQIVRERYEQGADGAAEFEFDFRLLPVDGTERTLHASGHEDPSCPGRYLGTFRDVSAERQAERERMRLAAERERAESANRAKSEFLARMSHELRTPLNAIMGFGQLLELENLPLQQAEHIGYVLKASEHLLTLINEVLDLAQIEADQIAISPEAVALADTVSEVLALVSPLAAQREVSLDMDLAGLADDGHVHADRHRFKQVLLNLLSNAVKYNRPGGRVHVSFQITAQRRVRTEIADTGIGIAPEQLPFLFVPFERLGAEQTGVEGTGLGLALSRGLVEVMGGAIEVDSVLGEGSRFTVELAEAERPLDALDKTQSQALSVQVESDGGEPAHTLLYIEDNVSNMKLVERILERAFSGVRLIGAIQGQVGLDLAREHHPDLILLDLHLPDMSGAEVLQRLKADRQTREIPVFLLTADAADSSAQRMRRLGAAECLTKPLDVRRFLDVLSAQLADGGS